VVSAAATARDVVRRILAAPARLGTGRLLCIDGPAGSGKTTLAGEVAAAVRDDRSVAVVHLDDVYPGWDGLAEGVRRASAELLEPLAAGGPGRYRRYDWVAGAEGEWCTVDPVDLLVLEGVGAGAAGRDRASVLVWVQAPADVRLARGLARDLALPGQPSARDELREHWRRWMADEEALHARDGTRERADVVVDGGDGDGEAGGNRAGVVVDGGDVP
jgi:uridine kinase